ncbi:unnamed protein product [Spirodela intermedia]|uniref:NB-ARC domain-containing protein n=1 Tax=Spirodela intermedia TaxID=51605 RepID=A0ABN7EC47_SPIIN|nr:unnamed protein product [Spirodela intermedia]
MNPFLVFLGFFWDLLSQGMQNFLQSSTGKPSPGCGIWPPVESSIYKRRSNKGSLRHGADPPGPGLAQEGAGDRVQGGRFPGFLPAEGASSEGSSLASSYKLGCEAAECLKEVQRLKTKRTISSPYSSRRRRSRASRRIYGLGGIGKTTLLKAINNEFLQRGSGGFDLVIWVTVSKELDVRKVQEDIAVRLGYSRPGKGQGQTLPEHPTDREFPSAADDLWEKLDLEAVGVPFSSSFRNGSKVFFTTRSEKVCNDMDAQRKVKVPLLNRKSSWTLFCQKIGKGEDQWNDLSIRSLAEAVCQKCGGLPITLITVGRAMAGVTTRDEWQVALMALKSIPAELGDMKEVLILLKFSFDRLKDTSPRRRLVKLHDTVREMALWITSGEGDKRGNVFLVNSGEQLRHVPTPERWTEARRISLMRNEIRLLPEEPRCPICRRFHAEPSCFRSVGDGNKGSPPEIGSLVELRYLNLSWTPLESLPMEVRNLTKLRHVRLEGTWTLKSIPREAVSSLERLQSLNIFMSNFRAGWRAGRQLCLKDLEDGMWNLTELGISITWMTHEDMQAVLNSQRLSASIRFLCVLEIMKGVRRLEIMILPTWKSWSSTRTSSRRDHHSCHLQNLRKLWISKCEALEDITWIRQLPCIETLELTGCSKIEEVIVVEEVTASVAVSFLGDNHSIRLPRAEEATLWLSSAKNIQEIYAEQEWWDGLQWEHEDVRSKFTPYFLPR